MRPYTIWLYLGGCILSGIAIISLSASLFTTIRKRTIVEERKALQEQEKLKHEELLKQSALVESPYFVEKEAREKLGLGREGESVVLLPLTASEAGSSVPVPKERQEMKSNMRQWWELFF